MNNLHDGDLEIEGLPTQDIQDKFENYQESQTEKLQVVRQHF